MLLAVAPEFRGRRAVIAAGFCFYPILAFALLAGGLPGLPAVSTERWGGLTLTMLVGMSEFVLSFHLAVLHALARPASLPALDRKRCGSGKNGVVAVDCGWRRLL